MAKGATHLSAKGATWPKVPPIYYSENEHIGLLALKLVGGTQFPLKLVGGTQFPQSDKQIILFFTGQWCVPCRIMKRNVWADDLVTTTVNAKFVPVMIDVDDPGAADTLRRYSVGSTPKTTIVDPDGNVLRQKEGGMSKAEFLGLLQPANHSDSNGL